MTPTFTLKGHYFSSPNQTSPPEPFAEPQLLPMPCSPTVLRNHVWALDGYPYLGFCDKSPFQGELFRLLAGSAETIPLEHGSQGWHLPHESAKSWKQLEQTLRQIARHLKKWCAVILDKSPFLLKDPELPSKFGYFTAHPTEDAARSGLRSSLDAFVVYFAYISFIAALSRYPGPPSDISVYLPRNIHPEFLNMFLKSHIIDFSGERKRIGTIINVLQCGWISIADLLFKAKVPIWLYWGDHPLTVTPRVGWMVDYRPHLADLNLSPVKNSISSLPAPLPSQPQSSAVLSHRRDTKVQHPGETYKQYFARRQRRNEMRMKIESAQDKQTRANRERASAGRQCPGRKGPAVYYWEPDGNDFRVRTLQTRRQVEDVWSQYSGPQKVFDSFENEWDCCTLFGDGSDTDDNDDIYPSAAPTLTAIPIASTRSSPPPIASTSSLPPVASTTSSLSPVASTTSSLPPVASTTSSLPPVASTTSSLPSIASTSSLPPVASTSSLPPHEESTSMDVDAPLHPPDEESTSPAPSYRDYRPRLCPSPRDDYDRRPRRNAQDDRPFGHRRNPERDNPERYGSHRRRSRDMDRPCRSSRDDSPGRFRLRTRDPRDDSPGHYHPRRDLQDGGGGRPLPRRSRSREPYQHNPNAMVTSHPPQESQDDLLAVSRGYVLSVHPPDTTITFEIETDSVEDYVYHRFGFHLDENPYTSVPPSAFIVTFNDWLQVLRSIGCHQLNSSLMHRQPIQEFLQCLLSTNDPLRDVPAKFWDLNTSNSASLNLAAGLVRIEPKTFLDGSTLYLIHSVDLNASRDSTWVLAVDAMTALECVRRRLGPHTANIANFLINRGIPFSTLRRIPFIPGPRTPPRPISTLLGTRSIDHKFDLADFSAYQFLCESVVKSKPFCRAALCMGGIVARLAREIIPSTTALLGPSQDALEGSQKILSSGGEFFCDDELSTAHTDLICGVYKIPTGRGSQSSDMSWFPKHNVWVQTGYNVGQWTQECESWFEKRMAEIQAGGQPLDSHTWRSKLRLTRNATKIVIKVNSAAASFIQAQSPGGVLS